MSSHYTVLLAYIDPGTGAIVLQVVVATLLTMGAVFRRILLAPFAKLRGKNRQTEPQFDAPADQEN